MQAYKIITATEVIETADFVYAQSFGVAVETIEREVEIFTPLVDFRDLLIYPLVKQDVRTVEELAQIDFTLVGLTTETPKYAAKGIKTKAEYTFAGKVVASKVFKYVATGLNLTINYHLEDGTVGYSKTEFKPLDKVELAKISRSNRDRSITYLQASAVGTPIETHVNALLKRYKTEVDLYIQNNTKDFENVINAETKQPFLAYLNIALEPNWTVKQAILKQIV